MLFRSAIERRLASNLMDQMLGVLSGACVVPEDSIVNNVLLSIQMRFGPVLERWILRHVQCFGLVIGFGIWTALWLWRSKDATQEDEDERV